MSMSKISIIPLGPDAPAACSVSLTCSPASLVRALLSVVPKIIWPIHDPAMPPAIPANRGFRCSHEGCAAGAGWAVGAGLAVCGGVAGGLAVADCSIGFALFC